MTIVSTTPFVAVLCLAGALAGAVLVRVLERRRGRTLRAKFVALFVGLIGAELSMLPALVVAAAGDDLFGLRASGVDGWIVTAGYAAVTLYAIVRLFPWSEVEAIAADPGTGLRDVVARIVAGTEETRDDEPRPP